MYSRFPGEEVRKPMGKTSTESKKKARTYIFRAVVEPDEERWFACCPILEDEGVATWGYTKEEALKNLREVLEMTIESMIDHEEPIPEEPTDQSTADLKIAVTM
jgi:predicted RNase H-like HicB family nuclease